MTLTMSSGPPDPVMVLGGNNDAVTTLMFAEFEGQITLFSGHLNGTIIEWCSKRQRSIHMWPAHAASVLWVSMADCGTFLFSQGREGCVKVWSRSKDGWLEIGDIPSARLTFCDSAVCEMNDTFVLAVPSGQPSHVNIHLIHKDSLSTTRNPKDLGVSHSLGPQSTQGYGMCMKVRAFVQRGNQPRLLVGYESGTVTLWDIIKSTLQSEVKLHTDPVMCMAVWPALSDSSDILVVNGVSGSVTNELHSWQVIGDVIHKQQTVSATNAGFNDITIRPDGRLFVTGGWDCAGRVFTVRKLTPLAVLTHHRQSVQSVAFSSDKTLALGGKDGYITLWDVYSDK